MRTVNSLKSRLVALALSIIMVLSMLPSQAIAQELTSVAQIGDVTYDTLADALADVPTGKDLTAPAEVTTIKLLKDTAYAFDVGTSNGSTTMNLKLDLNGNTLTLSPSVGSVGTKSSGIRVLAYSKLEITNGTLECSSTQEDNVKVGIANYGTLNLTDVVVKKGNLTQYTINNRGALTLNGKTTVESGSICAITNDPYDLYYTTDVNASVTCNSSEVAVESMLVERYERNSANQGGVELNISAGYFGKIVEDGDSAVSTSYNVTGGTIGVSTTEELEFALNMVKAGAEYACPQQPVTIKLMNSIAGSFDVGTSTGKAPKNILLDLNRNTLTLKPGVGSFNTKSNGIRVLAYSKLEIKNGTIICSSEEADNVKVGIANYSDLTLDSVAVKSGDLTIYTINNRGKLTLKGTTSVENAKAPHGDYADSAELIAITNDPYNLYYSTPINAEINCADSNVVVGNIQLETYGSKGDIELNITNGRFGGVYAPAAEGTVTVKGAISGGTFETDVSEYCSEKFTSVEVDGKYVTQYVKDDQVDFGFAEEFVSVTYNDNADNKYSFTVLNPKGTVTYTIVSGSEYATINAGTGELTVIKPGVVTVKASDTGNDLYNTAEATYTLTIHKDDQQITFATPVPEDQWIGAPFVNIVSGGKGTGEVSYSLYWPEDEDYTTEIPNVAKINPQTGEVTFLCVGTQVTVRAIKAADDYYNSATARYSVTATKKEPTEVTFATTGPITITYNPENLSFKNDVVGCGEDDVITWSIVSGDAATIDTATGALTINKAGTVVIKATVAESPYYFEKAIEYTLVINPANQADLDIGGIPSQITYSPAVQEGLIVGAGGSGTGAYGYEIVEGNEFAEINAQTGAIKVLKAGNFVGDEFVNGVIKVKITKAGDDCYNAAEPVYVTISLTRADQSGFGIGDNKSATVTYNDNNNQYVLNASGGQSTGDVVYEIYRFENQGYATVDNDGVISIISAGTVYIRIFKNGDDCYNASVDRFTLTIEKDEQDYSLTETGTIPLTYGTVSYTNALIKGTYVSTTNKPVYTISQNNIGASVNAETGEVTFADSEGKIGKATITVTVAEEACYKEFTTSYEIDVAYLTTDATPTTDGETKNTTGWYTDKVVIKAPAGYTIAYDNKLSTVWENEISFAVEGVNNATVYLKNSNGYITDKITVADIKLDTGNPDEGGISIVYDNPMWQKVLEDITFGIYKAETLLVKLSATDANSGIASLTYNIGGEDIVVNFNGESAVSHSFTINAQYRNKVTLKATDVAGREISKNSKHILVLDTKTPKLNAAYEYASDQHNEDNDIIYTQGDVTIHFTIEETNFDLSNAPVVTVDDDVKAVSWVRVANTDEWKADLTLTGNGDYVVKVTFTDVATNKMVTYVQEIRIDDVAPVLDVTYDNNEARNENNYKADRTATIQITEHNFKAEEVELTVKAKDITGAEVDISAKGYAEYAKNAGNWMQNGDVWTLNTAGMKFDIDAIYTVTLAYTDLAENAAEKYTTEFVVDKTSADNVTITYSTSVVEKVLEAVTFGLYKADVQVTITAEDVTSGVDYFEITYTQVDGANNSNKATYTTEKLVSEQNANDKTVFTATYTIEAEARGKVSVNLFDKAGNNTGKADEYVIVADTIAPGLEYEYTFTNDQVREYNNIFYTQGETKVKFTITEANFDLSLKAAAGETVAPAPVLTVNDEAQEITWTQIPGTDKWETEIPLTGNGDYVVKLAYTDRSTNEMDTYTKEVHIDNVAPEFNVTYDNNETQNENNYKADRTATIQITEHNFKAEEVELNVTAKDITGAEVDISAKGYAEYAKNAGNWMQNGDVWALNTAGMKFDIDAIYTVTLAYTDLAENAAEKYTTEFVVDKTGPANIQIKYSTPVGDSWDQNGNAYYPYTELVEVTLIAEDITSGVDFFTWTYTKEASTSDKNKTDETGIISKENIVYSEDGKTATATFVIEAQARGYISVDVTDKAGNTSSKKDNTRINVVDTIAPTRVVSYTPERVLDAQTLLDVETFAEGDTVILYYEKAAVVTFTIDEANFYAEDVVIMVNGKETAPTDWTQNGDVWTGTITISGDGDYVVTMTYTDRSTNEMVAYESQKIAIDDTDPTIQVEYDNNTALNANHYNADRTATITIVDHNFRADDVKVTVTAVDVQGNAVVVTDYAAYLSNRSNWTTIGDTHVAKITYTTDANYTFDIAYTDIVGNEAADYAEEAFVIDHAKPTNLKIEYSESIVDKIIEAITFGFYNPEVEVTLIAEDITSGVDYFDWTYTKEEGASATNAESTGARIPAEEIVYSNNGLTATATFKIRANARGYISATVTDKAGNNSSKVDDEHINIVDEIAPSITIEYVADKDNTKVQFVNKKLVTVDGFEKAAIAYYNGNVTAKIVINEANFFEGVKSQDGVIYNVGIKLTKTDDNGNTTVYEYLPEGAQQKYADATPKYITWATAGDLHSFNIHYKDNADYVLEIDYTDLSSNDADISANDGKTATKTYKSKIVTVDKVKPVVSVKYGNEKVIHTIDGRDYFDAVQTATITVQEHNFRADDFAATVTAKDILGENVAVENFKETLAEDSNWTKDGNTYTITIKYSVDANYTFDYAYKDLAHNAAAEYEEDLFTVDTTAPEKLTVSYSTSVLDKILESITFGYYNAEMTVTITAEDDTAGIHYFVYSYLNAEGVSGVNAELINDKIADANNRIIHEGKKSTTSFTIPKLLLKNDNQFNGTVQFTAFDRAENNTDLEDNRRVVVDNIAPTATISYNKPVQTANNASYYAGNIDAKIVINEANFYSEDVVVTVTKDGAKYPVNVTWTDDNVDVHTGTFTLTADGDYIVTVEYADRSENQMTKYTSNRLTLDTKVPSVNVSNIKNNSANKDEKYGFTITANDINLDASTFKPVLIATVRNEDGSYETKTVSLDNMRTVETGKIYSVTVDNLEEDAVYALTCTLQDMSGNQYTQIVLEDNTAYDEVRFSVNRKGSTFAVDKDTNDLVNQYYVYSVEKDVVIEEVNVDPVEIYEVKLNGEKLTEGIDYTTTLSNEAGKWSKRTYVISKDLFAAEGEYSIVVESTDKAETTAYSDVKNLNVSFVVDQTAPVLTISGLENSGRYQIEEQIVTIIPTDDGGRLYSIKVVVLDSDGAPIRNANGEDISVRFERSGEDFLTYLIENDGKVTFTIPEGLENQVQIICNDYAVGASGDTNVFNETYTKVTVSQSQWIIFYANKPLFYGSIAGVVLLAAGIILLIIISKKKKAAKK